MKDQEFSDRVDAILASGMKGHDSHRALDQLWMEYAADLGGPVAAATAKWFAHIEGDHDPKKPYPVGRLFHARPHLNRNLNIFGKILGFAAIITLLSSTVFGFSTHLFFESFSFYDIGIIELVLSVCVYKISALFSK